LVAPLVDSIKALHIKIKALFLNDEKQAREIANLKAENQSKDQEIKKLKNENEDIKLRLEKIEELLKEKSSE
ncbi:MAG: hypothetical protein KDD33_12030, partial [Bdellovibrionales bacterium]|nr:hypothetical protein [Bdellovibrionales bacterium]